MKNQLAEFAEFLKTPFPYLFLVLCLFVSSTLLNNTGFRASFQNLNQPATEKTSDSYELCAVCSGPGSKDALSDIGFTVANFVLFPVSLASYGMMNGIAYFQTGAEPISLYLFTAIFLTISAFYGVVLPFLISKLYEAADSRIADSSRHNSVYTGR